MGTVEAGGSHSLFQRVNFLLESDCCAGSTANRPCAAIGGAVMKSQGAGRDNPGPAGAYNSSPGVQRAAYSASREAKPARGASSWADSSSKERRSTPAGAPSTVTT